MKIIGFAVIGPAPFCSMLLADMGAQVLRIERQGAPLPLTVETLNEIIWKALALHLPGAFLFDQGPAQDLTGG